MLEILAWAFVYFGCAMMIFLGFSGIIAIVYTVYDLWRMRKGEEKGYMTGTFVADKDEKGKEMEQEKEECLEDSKGR